LFKLLGLTVCLGFLAYGCAGVPIKPEQHCAGSQGEAKVACLKDLATTRRESEACSVMFSAQPPPCSLARVKVERGFYSSKDLKKIAAGKKTVHVVCADYELSKEDGRATRLVGLAPPGWMSQPMQQPRMGHLDAQTLSYKTKLLLRYRKFVNPDGATGLDSLNSPKTSQVVYRSTGCALKEYAQARRAEEAERVAQEAARNKASKDKENAAKLASERAEKKRLRRVSSWQAQAQKSCASEWNMRACESPIGDATQAEVRACKSTCAETIQTSIEKAGQAAQSTCSKLYTRSKAKGIKACVIPTRGADTSTSNAVSDAEKSCRAECPTQAKELKRIAKEEARQARAAEAERKRIERLHKKADRCMASCMNKVYSCQERRSVYVCDQMGMGGDSCKNKCCGASGKCSCGGYGRGPACGR